jgi:hypothetical protein
LKLANNTKQLLALIVLLISLVIGFRQLNVSADSYDVSASVPFPVPTTLAVIDPSLNNLVKSTGTLQIFGSCQNVNPYSVVSIWRSSSLLGSTTCESNGTFRLNINLNSGTNTLIAKTSNISNVYGPDSDPVNITYNPPVAQSTPQNNNSVSNASSPTPDVSPDLSISTINPVEQISDSRQASIDIVVSGGKNPYKLVIVWGDGSSDTKDIKEEGTYRFTHIYEKEGIYTTFASVTDFRGITKTYQFVLASHILNNKKNDSNPQASNQQSNGNSAKPQTPFYKSLWVKIIGLQAVVLGLAYWLGVAKHGQEISQLAKLNPRTKTPSKIKKVYKK